MIETKLTKSVLIPRYTVSFLLSTIDRSASITEDFDYSDASEDSKKLAESIIKFFHDELSIMDLQYLIKACKKEIDDWNVEFGTTHKYEAE